MKNSLLTTLFIFLACVCIGQRVNDTNKNETIIGNVPAVEAPQRHPSADLIQQIQGKNTEMLDVVIKYQEEKETGVYANELKQELTRYGMKVILEPSEDALPPYTGSRYMNCSYEITDSVFIISIYPKKQ